MGRFIQIKRVMNRSLILSNFRAEFRRKNASYKKEAATLRWVRRFLDELSISHSSQIRLWHFDYFISNLKEEQVSFDELLLARSSIRFLFEKVLDHKPNANTQAEQFNQAPGSFRITA